MACSVVYQQSMPVTYAVQNMDSGH